MIIKQKRRIAIERVLATSKRRCILSLMSGIIILTVMALSLGVATGGCRGSEDGSKSI